MYIQSLYSLRHLFFKESCVNLCGYVSSTISELCMTIHVHAHSFLCFGGCTMLRIKVYVGGRYTEHTVIDLKHVIRAATACREVLS